MNFIRLLFTSTRDRKLGILYMLLGALFIVLAVDFARAFIGDGWFVAWFNISNTTGFYLFWPSFVLAIFMFVIALYHFGEEIF